MNKYFADIFFFRRFDYFYLLQLWAKPSGLSFQLAPVGSRKGNIAISFDYIDGKDGTVGNGDFPHPFEGYSSKLLLDRDEVWKRNAKIARVGKTVICYSK